MKKIYKILRILVILIILFQATQVNLACTSKDTNDNSSVSKDSGLKNYSVENMIKVNTLENLTKETGYYKFNLRPFEDVLNSSTVYAYDKYLIFVLKDSNLTVFTDMSSAYIIENNTIKEHRKINNYNQDSFLIDKSLHDTDIETNIFDGKIFQKFMTSKENTETKFKYLDENFPEIFHFKNYNYPGIILSYYLYEDSYELFGYNVIGTMPDSNSGTSVIYLLNNTTKNINDEEKEMINELIKLVNNSEE